MKEIDIGETTPGVVPWPKPIDQTGMYGIAGKFVELVSPHTEADPNAILLTFLTFAGNSIGRNYYLMAGADQHCGNLFTCLVGNTGYGRKGSAIATVEAFFRRGAHPPRLGHVLKGISTGEGIVYEVHDDIYKVTQNKKSQQYERTLVDPNEPEKRLLIILPEFHQCLAKMHQPESILSSILRQAWDNTEMFTPAKSSRTAATGASVSISAAISQEELLQQTQAADAENGFLNRIDLCCSRRSKLLPQGGKFSKLIRSEAWADLQERFCHNTKTSEPVEIKRDEEADLNWGMDETPDRGMYRTLNQARVGLWGAVTARAPQMVLRFALITAAINGNREIRREHLDAAFEMWRYCDESARYIFGDKLDDPTCMEVMNALREIQPAGLTRSQIYRIWSGHKGRTEIDRALVWISHSGIGRCEKIETGGRPNETWYAI